MNAAAGFRLLPGLFLSVAGSLLTACDDTDADPDPNDTTSDRVGWIDLVEINPAGTSIYVNLARADFWYRPDGQRCDQTVQAFGNGECTITTPVIPVCDPPCAGGDSCEWNTDCSVAQCVPDALQAGEISILGGSGQPEVSGLWSGTEGYSFDVAESDWWADGDTLTISAPGATFPAFDTQMDVPPTPTMITDFTTFTPETFTSGSDIPVDWVAGDGTWGVLVGITTDVELLCITDDDGHFDIPAEAVAAMGASPSEWIINLDYNTLQRLNDGGDGELMITVGTCDAAARIMNQ